MSTLHASQDEQVHGLPGSGLVRTLLVFLDLPVHFELRADPMPLIPEGTVIEFDRLVVRDPSNYSRGKTVSGPYRVEGRKCLYSTHRPSLRGLTQFLELRAVPP